MSIRMRHTRGHTGNRRSHHALKDTNVVADKETGNLRLPHRLDETTGMYRGKQIVTPKAKASKAEKVKGIPTTPVAKPAHEHAHEEHANAEAKSTKGIFTKIKRESRSEVKAGGRPKARSGFGGGV